jgi:hypothetical protein
MELTSLLMASAPSAARPETDGAVYVTGWTISGLAVIGAIVAVWLLGI